MIIYVFLFMLYFVILFYAIKTIWHPFNSCFAIHQISVALDQSKLNIACLKTNKSNNKIS